MNKPLKKEANGNMVHNNIFESYDMSCMLKHEHGKNIRCIGLKTETLHA